MAEFPFYDRRIDFHIHTRYMLNSTAHWQPLLNSYAIASPPTSARWHRFSRRSPREVSFNALKERRVRYITLNRGRRGYGSGVWPEIERRMQPYLRHLQVVADDGDVVIYEVVSWPK